MVQLTSLSIEDEPFLFEVYAGTRRDEIAAWGWAPAQQEAFLRMQFQFQQRAFAVQYPGAEHLLIRHAGAPAGQSFAQRLPDRIHLIDLALLPQFRGQGLGTAVLQAFQAEAQQAGQYVQLSVRKENTGARRLYERLGFTVTAESDTHYAMEWRPQPR